MFKTKESLKKDDWVEKFDRKALNIFTMRLERKL